MKVVDEGGAELFVRFQDYGFFVPRNSAGRQTVLHGRAEKTMADVSELRHYAKDGGASEEEIAAITEPSERVTFMATSAFIAGVGLDAPLGSESP